MKKVPHRKRQLASRAIALIARRRAKWLALQRGESVTKSDIAAGKQFAESFIKSLVGDAFWMKTIEDIAEALATFVNLAERQGAPHSGSKHAPKCNTAVTPDKIAVVREGLLELAEQIGKSKAKTVFIREGIPVRAPGSGQFIVGWVGKEGPDPVCTFWASSLDDIRRRVASAVKKGKITRAKPPAQVDARSKENAVNGIEAPPRKTVYEPSDFLPTADDMIGLGHSVSVMGRESKRRVISKKRYEAIIKRLACQLAMRRQCKPSPNEFAAAKKRVDTRLRRKGVAVAGAMRMGVSDIMAASYVLGAAASGSPAAKLAIMKSVEAAKEGSLRAKKDVKALAEAKKIRAAQGKGVPKGKPSPKGAPKKKLPAKVKAVAKQAAKKAAAQAKSKGASKPQAIQAAKAAAAKVVKKAAMKKAQRLGPPHKLPPKHVAEARKAVRRSMLSKKSRPKNKKEAIKRARLLRSFYGSPYPSHPAFRIHDV